jgi:hypothetical protein
MKRVSEFFGRIRNLQAREALVRLAVQQALKNRLTLEIPMGSISYKGATVILKGIDQAARSALFIKKASILKEINTSQSVRTIEDIC